MSNFENLIRLHQQIDSLLKENLTGTSPDLIIWKKSTLLCISKCYGKDSLEYKQFSNIHFSPLALYGDDDSARIERCKNGLKIAKGLLAEYINSQEENGMQNRKKIFIVHGHDETLKAQIELLLQQQDLEPIVLHKQTNAGDTIIQKIERYGEEVGAAIVLFTPDDTGKAKAETALKSRARQNVVFEAGFFMGLLGRNRVIPIVSDSSIEIPSDLNGVVYISDMWQFKVLNELKDMGFSVDMNKLHI